MLAAHEALIPAAGDRVTVLHLGAPLEDEVRALYLATAGSRIPLSEEDLADLTVLAQHCVAGPQPEAITVRENRAVINQVRLGHQAPLLVDTVTDVLRLACAASGGDVTLQEPTRFRSFRRPERRVLLAALDAVVSASPAKLGDVGKYREQWKRLGERLHPHEHPQWPRAQEVFAVARGDRPAASFSSRVEAAIGGRDLTGAVTLLASAPGLLLRSVDRFARLSRSASDERVILDTVRGVAGQVSGRVLLSVREHLQNRLVRTEVGRIFANRSGRAWVAADGRPALPHELVDQLLAVLDTEIASRLTAPGHLVVDPEMLGVALPLSDKAAAPGLGVLPRGSVTTVDGDLLRFFIHWRQRCERTDYDLSALLLDASLGSPLWVSWTSLSTIGGVHSGDIVQAPDGASEFIELNLSVITRRLIIPQVLVYSGEGFDEAEEAFFGFMLLAAGQDGAPFEPRTVRMKSDLRGAGRIALPVVFMRGDDGRWRAKWLHLYLRGYPSFNRVEENRLTTRLLLSSIIGRDYLRVSYLVDLLRAKATAVTMDDGGPLPGGPVTYLGLQSPDGLTADSVVYTPSQLAELIPL
jgi:hypothetical protein